MIKKKLSAIVHCFNSYFIIFREKPAFIGDFLYTEAGSIDIPWDYSQEKVVIHIY